MGKGGGGRSAKITHKNQHPKHWGWGVAKTKQMEYTLETTKKERSTSDPLHMKEWGLRPEPRGFCPRAPGYFEP